MIPATLLLALTLAVPLRALNARSRFIQDFLSSYQASATPQALDAAAVRRLSDAAIVQTRQPTVYDPSYAKLAYPGGDVPPGHGVCTDVVVRAFRRIGVDLQVDVHEDMMKSFGSYPGIFHRDKPDPNIDHRRVPNLMVFFSRRGTVLPISKRTEDYAPGDIVAWDLGDGVTHIGLVVDRKAPSGRHMIVHNIGRGPRLEDVLFDWTIIGHFRYAPQRATAR